MTVMSLPAQQKANTKRTGKRITFFNDQGVAMKEVSQHAEGSYYGMGAPPSDQGHNETGGVESSTAEAPHMYLNSVIFSPEKGNQNRGHYQQTMPMKWSQHDLSQQPHQRPVGWAQGITMTTWSQNFPPYLGGQTGFPKQIHENMAMPQQQPPSIRIAEKPQQAPNAGGDAFRDASKANRSLDWEQQQQQQHFQQGHKPGLFNPQPNVTSATGNTSVLQPFQVAFGQPKQNLTAGYYQVYHSNRTMQTVNYGSQTNSQHQIQQLQQQEQQQQLQQQQQMQRLILQKQKQQLQQKQQHLLQQQTQQQAHHQQQMLQQSQQMTESQQTQQQAKHLNQMQQSIQFHPIQMQQQIQQHLHKSQQQQQQQQQQQLSQAQNQQKTELQKHQKNQQVVEYSSGGQHPPVPSQPEQANLQSAGQSQDIQEQPTTQDLVAQCPPAVSQHSMQEPGPRRSRRLSKEGGALPPENPILVPAEQQTQGSHNGAPESGEPTGKQAIRAAPTGVIQSTRRKRRVSQEANLETLAQKASEMESLPSQTVKEPRRPWSPPASGPGRGVGEMDGGSAKRARDESLMPLVIPVSVPVRPADPSSPGHEQNALSVSWSFRPNDPNRPDHKPSVIVTRRRSLRNSLSESSSQNGGAEGSDADGKLAKAKRRPRPEPLIIPPPKLSTFIAPPVYSNITSYQSHLRSPVRLTDNPLTLPPYTPPPILSPVREGSGLYFSTILSAAAAAASGAQGLPPPATPKSATRSLLRSNSTEITPPVLSAMSEATPVSVEPRINIGQRYQAEVPELRERLGAQLDPHKAEMVWAPLLALDPKGQQQERVDELMHLACSSAMCGGGTNQELAMHCLHECKGDIMGALALLLLKNPIFPKSHPLADYHYSGSDCWTPEERRSFNKGIATYKKDFFMVQKMVNSKTVAQCVEFYYTYKKQVKIGRNGTLTYGEQDLPETRPTEEEVDYKSSQRFDIRKEEEEDRKWEESGDRKRESSPDKVTQSLQATENAGTVVLVRTQEEGKRDLSVFGVSHTVNQAPTTLPRPRPESTVRKSGVGTKSSTAQEGEFPCKKCGRVFYKVKSRSAHMKSHAEQEKKAAALRQREAEERAAAAALMAAQQNGARGEQMATRRASSEDSSDEDDSSDDEDWN